MIDIGLDPRLDGYTGADLSSLVKESATQALQEFVFGRGEAGNDVELGNVCVHLRHFQAAITKIRPSVNEKVSGLCYRCNKNRFELFLVLQDRKHYAGMSNRL